MQTADCRLADYISCYLYEYILYIPIPIRSASLANRSSSLANPSASLQVGSLHLSHTVGEWLKFPRSNSGVPFWAFSDTSEDNR